MRIVVIAAKSDNNVIGKENDFVWHLPADQLFFKQQIENSLLITGRKSFESPHGQLIFKDNPAVIVISKQKDYPIKNAMIAPSPQNAVEMARNLPYERVSILGGAAIYEASMDLADELIITEVHATFDGDTFFPQIKSEEWKESRREDYKKDLENPFDYSFVFYKRI